MKINYEDKLQAQQNIINHLADKNIELQKCYDHNLSLCKWQEKRISILADCLLAIEKVAKQLYYTDLCENKKSLDEILDEVHQILQLIEKAEEK